MNILYIITGLGIGGAEIVTVDIANKMVRKGHDVSILSLTDYNLIQERIDSRINIHTAGLGKNPFSFLKTFFSVRRYVKHLSPDVVHANMYHSNLFARILRLCVHLDFLICSAHSQNEGGSLRMWAYRLTDCLSDLNTNVSNDAVSHYIRNKWFSGEKSICVYNGIDQSRFQFKPEVRKVMRQKFALKDDDFCLLFVGRMAEPKDIPNLLEAFAILSAKHDNVKLVLVGGGELQDEMSSLAKTKGIADRLFFEGSRSNVVDYYSMADCFVMPSAWEGFGMVLVEAMSCGLPVVTTDAGGCAEVVSDKRFIVPIKDSVALAEKIKMVMSMSPLERESVIKQNYLQAERFSLDRIVDTWEEIYANKKAPQKKL